MHRLRGSQSFFRNAANFRRRWQARVTTPSMLVLKVGFGVSPEADYPDLPAGGYHLRFTRRALEDLRQAGAISRHRERWKRDALAARRHYET